MNDNYIIPASLDSVMEESLGFTGATMYAKPTTSVGNTAQKPSLHTPQNMPVGNMQHDVAHTTNQQPHNKNMGFYSGGKPDLAHAAKYTGDTLIAINNHPFVPADPNDTTDPNSGGDTTNNYYYDDGSGGGGGGDTGQSGGYTDPNATVPDTPNTTPADNPTKPVPTPDKPTPKAKNAILQSIEDHKGYWIAGALVVLALGFAAYKGKIFKHKVK